MLNELAAGNADVLVRTASEARAAGSRFALIADEDVRALSVEALESVRSFLIS